MTTPVTRGKPHLDIQSEDGQDVDDRTGVNPNYAVITDCTITDLMVRGEPLKITCTAVISHNDVAAQDVGLFYRVDGGAWTQVTSGNQLTDIQVTHCFVKQLPANERTVGPHTYEFAALSAASTVTVHGTVVPSRSAAFQ
jgi:hypothetical protein